MPYSLYVFDERFGIIFGIADNLRGVIVLVLKAREPDGNAFVVREDGGLHRWGLYFRGSYTAPRR
jgi:hypothetical protein